MTFYGYAARNLGNYASRVNDNDRIATNDNAMTANRDNSGGGVGRRINQPFVANREGTFKKYPSK